ncbi:MAG TPA: hypothetical protein VNO84_04505 [Burkholderiaceae bacterium]|nr:hypothetical protein [Burkholderiaceae bacterium]
MKDTRSRVARQAAALLVTTCLGAWLTTSHAVSISPAGDIVAQGKLRYRKGFVTLECLTTFTSHITPEGKLTVRAADFGSNGLCGNITPRGLPWSGQAESDTILVIHDAQVQVDAPLLGGPCGPSRLELIWDNAQSTLTFKDVVLKAPKGSDCTTNGVITVTPALDVKP